LKYTLMLMAGSAIGLSAFAQTSSQQSVVVPAGTTPIFVVNEVSRTVVAVNYQHRNGASSVDFAGTALLPSANGTAKVRSKRGTMEVEAEFGNLQSPTIFGNEYLTYVLWAISPDGRASNLGEILIGDNDRSKLKATANLQAFALIVTAEPYYAVHQPSNVVVLENVVRADTKGTSEAVDAKYELMERGGYIPTGYKFDPVVLDAKLPLEFLEACNAVRIAKSEGAETYAVDSYQHAVQLMNTADTYATQNHSAKKQLIATSRETVQTAEDARSIAVKKIEDVRRADERQASSDAQARSQAQADSANLRTEQAQSDAAGSQAQADSANLLKEQAQSDAARSQAQADSANLRTEQAQSDAAGAQASEAQAHADLLRTQSASDAAVTAAQADAAASRSIADKAQQDQHQSDSEKAVLRAQLSEQLNRILATRDSARGLIVSMSDVLFDTGMYSLKPGAREKLAKVAGILIAYPSLDIQVGGYTDNVGGDELNQRLSENRAGAVRDYLVGAGVATDSVTAKGFGNSEPVASNDNSAGRQENRRVELVVSGDAIGNPVNPTVGRLQ
jgi:outer membrane protein OmpA-like peptidoglycan-associated protein